VDMVLGTTLLASNKQRQQSLLALFAIPLNIGMNFLLIPYFQIHGENGGVGAGIATVITELFIMIVALILMPKGIFSDFRFPVVLKGLIAGTIMALFVWVFSSIGLPWVILAVLCPFVYGTALLLMRTFESSEQAFFLNMLKFRNLRSLVTGKSKP
jgi:Na+-driven multidrug efflux pump